MSKFEEAAHGTADILRSIIGKSKDKIFTSAIIAAGGSSVRLGGTTTKQMIEVCGLPVVVHTLLAFQNCKRITEIVIVAKADEVNIYKSFIEQYNLTKVSAVVEGGATRQESVLLAFNKISDKAKYVAIHDAARCLITEDDILKVLDDAIKYGAATASVSAFDTVKIADKRGFIRETVDRNTVRMAQTPQIFSRNLYCAAAYTAKEDSFEATDDNMLCERLGHPVKLTETSRENIKITTKEDLLTAEKILTERAKRESENV